MISSSYSPDQYSGNDVLDTFAFTSRILAKTDLIVKTIVVATNVVTTLTLNADYIIDDADVNVDGGGDVVLTDPLPTGTNIFLIRKTARTQGLNIGEGFAFSTRDVMVALDRLTMIAQELEYSNRKSIKLPDTSSFVDIDAPLPSAGRLLRWNDDADGLENTTAAAVGANLIQLVIETVDQGDTTVTLNHGLNDASAIIIGQPIATWQTTFKFISQGVNTITLELGTECPDDNQTVRAAVGVES